MMVGGTASPLNKKSVVWSKVVKDDLNESVENSIDVYSTNIINASYYTLRHWRSVFVVLLLVNRREHHACLSISQCLSRPGRHLNI